MPTTAWFFYRIFERLNQLRPPDLGPITIQDIVAYCDLVRVRSPELRLAIFERVTRLDLQWRGLAAEKLREGKVDTPGRQVVDQNLGEKEPRTLGG